MKNKFIITIFLSAFLLFAPSVHASNFIDNQTVDANKTWTIKFNSEVGLDNGKIQGITVTGSKGATISAGVQLGEDGKTVEVVAPEGGYTPGESYILNIGTKVHSNKGKALKNECKIHFNIKSNVPTVISASKLNLSTTNGVVPSLPDTVYVTLSNGTKENASITWNSAARTVSTYTTSASTITINGVLAEYNNYPVTATVTITPARDHKSLGNSSSNIINNGIAAIQGDWIYYRNEAEFGNLYKIRSDGTGDPIKLNDDNVSFINVVGDYVYYCNGNLLGGNICEINTDGTNRKELSGVNATCMQVIGSNIYYAAGGDPDGVLGTGTIYKMDLNTNKNVSLKLRGDKFIINNNTIYYYSFHSTVYPSSDLYQAQIDGSHNWKTNYNVDNSSFAISSDNTIYFSFLPYVSSPYTDYSTYENLLKWTFGSSETKTLVNNMCTSINLNGNFIYYVANQSIYQASLDGENQTVLSSASDNNPIYTLSSINVVGDWVYYIENASGKYYRVKTDGTCYQEVN